MWAVPTQISPFCCEIWDVCAWKSSVVGVSAAALVLRVSPCSEGEDAGRAGGSGGITEVPPADQRCCPGQPQDELGPRWEPKSRVWAGCELRRGHWEHTLPQPPEIPLLAVAVLRQGSLGASIPLWSHPSSGVEQGFPPAESSSLQGQLTPCATCSCCQRGMQKTPPEPSCSLQRGTGNAQLCFPKPLHFLFQ